MGARFAGEEDITALSAALERMKAADEGKDNVLDADIAALRAVMTASSVSSGNPSVPSQPKSFARSPMSDQRSAMNLSGGRSESSGRPNFAASSATRDV